MTGDMTFQLRQSEYAERELSSMIRLMPHHSEVERAFHRMADFAPVFIWVGEAGNIKRFYFNKVWLDFRGRSVAEEAEEGWLEGIHPDDYYAFRTECSEACLEKKPYKVQYRFRRKDGVFRWILETGVPFLRPDGALDAFVGSCVGIDEQKELEGQLFKMAHYDILTGIANRSLFVNRLEHSISISRRYKQMFALLYIDLDGFKTVNDRYGHKAGDILLVETAKRLNYCVRESDTTARMGGDEFTVILSRINGQDDALLVAEKIAEEIAKPFVIFDRKCYVTASVGVGIFPNDAVDAETLLKKADADMYCKKGSRQDIFRNRYS
jgi:diguanylate cyclase (GGDEF)-like protein/PAS domain S-box-containing protein